MRGLHLLHDAGPELSNIYSRDLTDATFCQGPYEESAAYRDFMGWEIPGYSAQDSLDTL